MILNTVDIRATDKNSLLSFMIFFQILTKTNEVFLDAVNVFQLRLDFRV